MDMKRSSSVKKGMHIEAIFHSLHHSFPGSLQIARAFLLSVAFGTSVLQAQEIDFAKMDTLACDTYKEKPVEQKCRVEVQRRNNLHVLYLRGPRYTNGDLNEIFKYPNLTSLVLSNANINDSGLPTVTRHPKLYYINLEGTHISNAGLATLNNLKTLGMLDVSQTGINDRGLPLLKKPWLSYINLSRTSVSEKGLEDLAANWPRLHRLDLMDLPATDNTIVKFIGVESQAKFDELASKNQGFSIRSMLGLDKKRIPVENKGLTELSDLNLAGTKITNRSIPILSTVDSLRLLNLAFTDINDEGAREIPRNEDLEVLSLSGTKITDHGVKHLVELKKLKVLSLEKTDITNDSLDQLMKIKTLRSVYLEGTKVTTKGLDLLHSKRPELKIHFPGYAKESDNKEGAEE